MLPSIRSSVWKDCLIQTFSRNIKKIPKKKDSEFVKVFLKPPSQNSQGVTELAMVLVSKIPLKYSKPGFFHSSVASDFVDSGLPREYQGGILIAILLSSGEEYRFPRVSIVVRRQASKAEWCVRDCNGAAGVESLAL